MKERIIIIILAVVSGLVITTIVFFIYQNFIDNSNSSSKRATSQITPQPTERLLLDISEPLDGSLTDIRTLSIKGVTNPENVVVISSNQEDNSGKPSKDGNFSITITIDTGANFLVIRSIAPDGNEIQKELVVTYTTEEF